MTIAINGTGSIVGLSAGGLPDAIVQQADLAPNVAGNGPAFSAYQSAAQTLANGVATKLQFQTEEFDTANSFDSTTNYRFQPTVAGYYQISGGMQIATAATTLLVLLYKNGANYKTLSYISTSAAAFGSALVYLNGTTDYVEIFGQQNAASQNLVAGATFTYFQGFLARAA